MNVGFGGIRLFTGVPSQHLLRPEYIFLFFHHPFLIPKESRDWNWPSSRSLPVKLLSKSSDRPRPGRIGSGSGGILGLGRCIPRESNQPNFARQIHQQLGDGVA